MWRGHLHPDRLPNTILNNQTRGSYALNSQNNNPASKMKKSQLNRKRLALAALGGAVIFSSSILATAGESKPVSVESASVWEKPVWLTDLSLRVGESYDSNVYLTGNDVASGDHIATKNKGSAVTTISPKIGVDFATLLDKDSIVKVFSLGYAPDFVLFHNASTESYAAHRLTTNLKAKADNVTFTLENALLFINGDHEGLAYPSGASAYANSTIRERRDQWQDRTKATVKVDLGPIFVRPTFSLLYYDLGTSFQNVTGYTNFIDRYDINGGTDVGYNVTKDVAFTLGYRYGRQSQAALPFDLAQINASSDYQRVLFGVEGTPLKWLKVEGAVGPQFTSYTNNRPYNGGALLSGRIKADTTDVFAEASVTVSPTAADALVLKYKRWNWVSSTGKNAYRESIYDASFRHQITKALQLELGFRASQSDYNPSSFRNDWLYTTSAGVKYAVTKNLGLDVSYAYDRGRNDQLVGVPTPSTRQFERSVVSTGVTWKF